MEEEIDIVKKEECPICYYIHELEEQCDQCKWKCCNLCAEEWAKTSNTCMICKKILFENVEDNTVLERIQYGKRVVMCILTVVDIFLFTSLFLIGINIIYYPFYSADAGQDENFLMCMFTMVVVAMLITLRSVAKNILETCCMPYITGSYTAFTDESDDSSGDV